MSNHTLIKEIIVEVNKKAQFLDGFDKALIGTGRISGRDPVAVYNSDEILRILIEEHQMDEIEAFEHFQSSLGKQIENNNTPIFINDFRKIVEVGDIEKNVNSSIDEL